MYPTIDSQAANQPRPLPLTELGSGLLLTLALALPSAAYLQLSAAYILLVAVLYGLTAAVIAFSWRRYNGGFHTTQDFGWANRVTLLRALIVILVAALAPFPEVAARHGWLLALLSFGALVLDGVDGKVARRTGSSSAFGSRFDMELDAFFILILTLLTVSIGKAGIWVLSLGLIRYGFLLATWLWPWLQQPLPESFRRKTVCVWQIATLLLCLAPPVSASLASAALALALVLLIYSFAVDLRWLASQRIPSQESLPSQVGDL